MTREQFEFALEHCPKAALVEIKQYFRRYQYKEAMELTREMVEAYCRTTGKSRAKVGYTLRQTSEFAGLLF